MKEQSRLVKGVRIRWEETLGGGPDPTPVVLVHGIPTSPALFRHVVPLVAGARCLAFEMVGYGRSALEGRGRDISVGTQASYLIDWLDALGVERAVLVGHDLGGGVVQIAAARNPTRCSGIVLTNAVAYDSWPIPSVSLMRATSGLVARMPRGMFHLVLRSFLARGHDDENEAREAYDVHRIGYDEGDGARAFARQVASLRTEDTLAIAELLPTLQIPARVVWGMADQFQKAKYGERLAKDLGTTLVPIEGGKHFTPEDHPWPIARAINEVIAEVVQREPVGFEVARGPPAPDARPSASRH